MNDSGNDLLFSAASIWEVAIKRSLGRSDFRVDPPVLRRSLLDNGYFELQIMRSPLTGCLLFTRTHSIEC
jgi:PIN domain nuclease of toxin-antitoxin system